MIMVLHFNTLREVNEIHHPPILSYLLVAHPPTLHKSGYFSEGYPEGLVRGKCIVT